MVTVVEEKGEGGPPVSIDEQKPPLGPGMSWRCKNVRSLSQAVQASLLAEIQRSRGSLWCFLEANPCIDRDVHKPLLSLAALQSSSPCLFGRMERCVRWKLGCLLCHFDFHGHQGHALWKDVLFARRCLGGAVCSRPHEPQSIYTNQVVLCCIGRKMNPGLPYCRREFYHWTTNAQLSGRILACHAGGRGSIPGQCKHILLWLVCCSAIRGSDYDRQTAKNETSDRHVQRNLTKVLHTRAESGVGRVSDLVLGSKGPSCAPWW